MQNIKTVATQIPEELHKDFRWAAKIAGHSVQQAVSGAIENYIAQTKAELAKLTKKER